MNKLNIVFFGTAYFSAEHLKALITASYNIVLIITQPDRPSGRGQKITFSPVKKISISNKIPIFQPLDLNDVSFQKTLEKVNANMMIVVAYGKIIPKKILNMFSKGCINVHASLLPRWRGPTPIQSAILSGDTKTGISIINMNEKIDSGTIIYSKKCNISSQDTTYSLSLKLTQIGIQALLKVLEKIVNNIIIIQKKQNEKNVILSKKIYKKDGLLNWSLEAKKLERLIRAFNPWPVGYFVIKNKTVKVWQASIIPIIKSSSHIGEIILVNNHGIQINTSNKILNIEKLQLPGKKITDVKSLLDSKNKLFETGYII